MNPTREKATRKRRQHKRTFVVSLILAVSIGLLSVAGSTVVTCYAAYRETQTADSIGSIMQRATFMPQSITLSTVKALKEPTDLAINAVISKPEQPGEKVTRMNDTVIRQWDEDLDYPQLMKDMLSKAQAEPDNAAFYLQLAEVYECQSNLKVAETGEGEITHIFSKWNEDLDEMDTLLYETYPFYPYTEHDVLRLARIIHAEAGSSFVTTEHQRDVASVPINRVLSPAFPGNTIDEIIDYPGQYPGTRNHKTYTQREWDNALYVLQHGPTTTGVYQANFVVSTATEVLKIYEYPEYSWVRPTYICR